LKTTSLAPAKRRSQRRSILLMYLVGHGQQELLAEVPGTRANDERLHLRSFPVAG
jgi:hypothetical protein